ncbi:TfuA-like protein [Streptomyces silvisoli]|uniref:TfuA-like protein n=1 Tax=Streptomyces silvisoli TaxID=3034235 RepID=A0ABT5ZTB1_9ACTN|nr:TfuA-like protein [Streptomyces silvisoli]MDF3292253.1 TfuA-like protein [Streptomyces silvisoli]
MTVHVFAGPTITPERITDLLPQAEVHPPVQHGDLLRLPVTAGDTVLIIDGLFQQAPAVRHKEILHLIHSGVRVAGTSSMGALRAAELHRFGMIGIGQVFRWYADGTVTADDEVAVSHLSREDGYRQMSDPLVSVRYGLGCAVDVAITAAERDALFARAAELPFAQRSWRTLWRITEATPLRDAATRARGYLAEHPRNTDVKLLDAESALRWVLDNPTPDDALPSHGTRPVTLDTVYLADWRWENTPAPSGDRQVSDYHTLGFLQLFLPAYPQIYWHTAVSHIGGDAAGALSAARAAGLLGTADEPGPGMREWLTDNELATRPGRDLVLTALVRSFRTAPGVRTGHTLPELVSSAEPLVRLARNCAAAAGALNAARRQRHPDFQVEHVRTDLVEEFFTRRWQCADLENACWDRGLTGIGQLHELGRYFLLLGRSGRVPEQALAAVTIGAATEHGKELR